MALLWPCCCCWTPSQNTLAPHLLCQGEGAVSLQGDCQHVLVAIDHAVGDAGQGGVVGCQGQGSNVGHTCTGGNAREEEEEGGSAHVLSVM
jgi:hypothetical protein